MQLPHGWYVILDSREVTQKPLGFRRFGIPLVAWRKESGEAVIMSDLCPHRGAKLSLGCVKKDEIECPFHGFRFDSHGSCTHVPEINRAAPGIRNLPYLIREERGWIWLHWGECADPKKPLPWFSDLPELLHMTRTEETWPVHFTRSVENQLDYAHLPFVHRTSIGRFAQIGTEPKHEITPDRLKWYFDQTTAAGIEFVYPNIWLNLISKKYFLTLAFVPVEEGQTKLYLRSHRASLTLPPFSWIMDAFDRFLNRWILGQDRRVVLSQEPFDSREAKDQLVGSDRFIRAFREWVVGGERKTP